MITLDLTNVTADTPVPPEVAALIAAADARYAAALSAAKDYWPFAPGKHRADAAGAL